MTEFKLKRLLESRLPDSTSRRLVMITGARQVGKTTLAKDAYPNLKYISFDSIEDRESLAAIPTARWASEVGAAVLDEAQKEAKVFEKVKYAFDAKQLDFTVLLGSAHMLMLERVRETLAGRVFLYELWPLTVAEIAAGGSVPPKPIFVRLMESGKPIAETLRREPSVLLGDDDAARRVAARHISIWGGMPELLSLQERDRRDWLRSYHNTYLQRDLADLKRLRDLGPFFTFQKLAALRTGTVLSFADLARDAGTSAGTARNYLEYLKISYQAFLLPPFRENLTSAVIKSPKLYWSDVGLCRYLSGAWGPITGPLFESLVVAEAVKFIRTLSLDVEPFFYRTHAGLEVDLLLALPSGIIAIEAKARESWAQADLRGLRALGDALSGRFLGGIVLTSGGSIQSAGDDGRFWVVPFHRLFT